MPSLTSVHTNKALGNVAVNYKNAMYVLEGVAPVVRVANESDVYYTWTKGDIFADEAQAVMPGARAPRSDFGLSTATYTTQCYKFAWPVPDRIKANADQAVKAEIGSARLVADKIMLSRERTIATLLTTTGNWTTTAAIAAGSEWDSAGGGDPIGDIETAVTTVQGLIGQPPNTLAMSYGVFRALRKHAALRDYVKYAGDTGSGPPIVTQKVISDIFDIPRIFVVGARYRSTDEGQTATISAVMTDTVWVGFVANSPGITEPSAAYVFQVGDMKIKTFREEAEEQDVIEGALNFNAKAVVADAGYTITNALA